jgi:hypothetical protein
MMTTATVIGATDSRVLCVPKMLACERARKVRQRSTLAMDVDDGGAGPSAPVATDAAAADKDKGKAKGPKAAEKAAEKAARELELAQLLKHSGDVIVVDEAHELRNANGARARAMGEITSFRRLALTGCVLCPLCEAASSVCADSSAHRRAFTQLAAAEQPAGVPHHDGLVRACLHCLLPTCVLTVHILRSVRPGDMDTEKNFKKDFVDPINEGRVGQPTKAQINRMKNKLRFVRASACKPISAHTLTLLPPRSVLHEMTDAYVQRCAPAHFSSVCCASD